MTIDIASLQIPIEVTGQSAVAAAFRETERAGARAAQSITDSQAKAQKGATLTAVELKSVTRGLVALGYSAQQAQVAVSQVLAGGTLANQSAVLRAALVALQGPLAATTAGLEAEAVALKKTTAAAATTTTALTGLSKRGLGLATSATTALAVSASGVPGPLGRIGLALLLLGGVASGPLLLVTAGVAALAIGWNKLGRVSDEAKSAIERMNGALVKQSQALLDIAAADAEVAKQRGLQRFFAFFAEGGTSGLLGGLAQKFGAVADEIERTARAFTALSAHGAADDWLARFNRTNPMPKVEAPKSPKAAAATGMDWWQNQAFAMESYHRDLMEQVRESQQGLYDVTLNNPLIDEISDNMAKPFEEAAKKSKEQIALLNDIVTTGIVGVAAGLGAALAGDGNITDVLLGALGGAFQTFGAAIITGSILIKAALASLATLNPVAAVGLGVALVALGSMLSTAARKSFGGATAAGYGGGQQTPFGDTTVTRSGTPGGRASTSAAARMAPATPVQQFFTIIGPNDPGVQRQIALATAGAKRRGY